MEVYSWENHLFLWAIFIHFPWLCLIIRGYILCMYTQYSSIPTIAIFFRFVALNGEPGSIWGSGKTFAPGPDCLNWLLYSWCILTILVSHQIILIQLFELFRLWVPSNSSILVLDGWAMPPGIPRSMLKDGSEFLLDVPCTDGLRTEGWVSIEISIKVCRRSRMIEAIPICEKNQNWDELLVGGLEHGFYFFHILGIIIPTDFHIFQRGRYTGIPPTRFSVSAENSLETCHHTCTVMPTNLAGCGGTT